MTLKELGERAARIKALGTRLKDDCERAHSRAIDTAAAEQHRELMKGELRHFPRAHTDKVLDNIKMELRSKRGPRAAVALYDTEKELMAITPTLDALKAELRRAPDAETAWLQRTREAGVNADRFHQIRILDRLTRAELREETRDWNPSRWRAEYQRALSDPTTQEAAAFIRFCEDRHGDGFAGPTPADARELTISHDLKKLIDATRDARIPRDVADAEAVVVAVKRVAQRARDEFQVVPINPANTNDPVVAQIVSEAS